MKFNFIVIFYILFDSFNLYGQCKAQISANTSICYGQNVTISSDVRGNWFYSEDNFKSIRKENSMDYLITPNNTTTYKFLEKGCKDSLKVTITVNLLPSTPSFSYSLDKCSNEVIEFTNTTIGSGLTYNWNFGNATSTLVNPTFIFPSVFGNSINTYNVTLEASTTFGCKSSFTKSINLKQIPDPLIEDNTSKRPFINCGGIDFELNIDNSSSTKNSNIKYEINWGDGTPNNTYENSSFSKSAIHNYSKKGFSDLIVKVVGNNRCFNQRTYTVFNGSNPSVGSDISETIEYCAPVSLTFPISKTNSNPVGTIYIIETNTGKPKVVYNHPPPTKYIHLFDSTSCGAVGADNPNTYFVKITAKNPCAESKIILQPITTSIKPTAIFVELPQNKSCINSTVKFSNTSKDGVIVNSFGDCDKKTQNNWLISPSNGWIITSGSLGDPNPSNNPNTWGSNKLEVKFSKAGVYYISMIVRNSCGNDTITKPYCIQSPPEPSFTVTPKIGCSPLVLNLTNTSTNLNQCDTIVRKWLVTKVKSNCENDSTLDYRFISGTNESSLKPIIRFNNEGEYNVTLQLINMCGMFQSTNEKIVVGRKPKLFITAPSNVCFGESVNPTAISKDCGNTITSYNWTFSNGTPTSSNTLTAPNITYSSSGIKTISLEATNSCGTTKEIKSIDILNPPIVDAGVDQKICSGETITLGPESVNGMSYNWSPMTGLSSTTISKTTFSLINNTNAPIIYKYFLTVTNIAGCRNIDSIFITVNPLPTLTITPASEICDKNKKTLIVNGTDTYNWSPSKDLNSTTGNSVISTTNKTITYTVIGTNTTTKCKNSITTTITVNPLPTVDSGDDQALCNQPIPVKIKAKSNGGVWSGANITSDGTYTPNGLGTTKAYYTIKDVKGCENKDSILVTVKNPEIAEAGNNISECLNTINKSLNGTPSGGTWSGPPLVSSAGIVSFNQEGTYKLYYIVGSGSCQTKDSIQLIVKSLPIISTGNNITKCINDADFNLIGTPIGGTWSGTGVTSEGLFSPSSAKSGEKKISYTYKDNVSSCSNSDDLLVTINDVTTVNAGIDTTVCNQPIPFQLKGNPKNGTWSGSGITSDGIFTPTSLGKFKVTYTFTNNFNCTSSDTRDVEVNNPTKVEAGLDISRCYNDQSVNLTGKPSGGIWNGPSFLTTNGVLTFNQVGTFQLFYFYGAGSCKTKDSIQLVVKPLPAVSAGLDQPKCINDADFNLIGTPIGGLWSGTGVTSEGLFSPTVAKTGVKTITYSYTDALSKCINKDEVLITINDISNVNAGIDTTVCNQPIPFKLLGSPLQGVWTGKDISSEGIFTPNSIGIVTLTYTFKNLFNCSNSDTREIKVINPTDADAGPDVSICIDTANIQLNGSPSNGIWNGNSNVSQSGVFKPKIAGNFKLYYNYGTGTCARKDSTIINVKSLPIIVPNTDTSICVNGGDITLKCLPTGGIWTGNGININSGIFSPSITGIGDYKVIYQFRDPTTSCKNKKDIIITVNDTTHVNAGQDTTVCNQPYQIQLIGKPAGGKWTGSNITIDGKFTPNGIGKFKVKYTYKNSFHCNTFDERIIEVVNPTLAKAGNHVSICIDTTGIQLKGSPNNGYWTGNSIDNTGFFSPKLTGSFKVYYNFGSGACATKDSLIVKVNPLPTINLATNLSSCINSSIFKLSASPLNGYWMGKGVDSSGNFNSSLSGLGITKVNYNFRDQTTKCFNSKELLINIHDTTTLFVGSDTTLCNQPLPVQLFSNPKGGNWSGANITMNGLFTPTKNGEFVVSYSYTNTFSCKNIIQRKINIISPIQANAGKDDSICFDQPSIQLTGLPLNGIWSGQFISPNGIFSRRNSGKFYNVYSYGSGNCLTRDTMKLVVHNLPIVRAGNDKSFCWSDKLFNFNGQPIGGKWRGQGIIDEVKGTFDPTKVNSGNYNLVYSYFDIKTGCTNEDTLTVTVNSLPVVDFILKPTICINVEEQIVNNTKFHGTSYWDFGNGTFSRLENPTINFSKIGSYTVKLIETSPFGCIDSLSKTIQVWDLPKANFTVDKDSLCSPAKITIYENSYGSELKYNWDFGNSTFDSVKSPLPITYLQGVIADTIYQLKLSVSNLCGISTLSKNIKVMPIPTAIFHTNVLSGCTPLPIEFYNKTLGLPLQYNWDFGNGTSITKDSLFQRVFTTDSLIKTYQVKLIARNNCGSDTLIKSIIVKPNIVNAFFSVDKIEGCNNLKINFTQNSIGSTFHSWDFGDGSTSLEKSPSHIYTKPGKYTSSLYITNGCSVDTARVNISVYKSPIVDFSIVADSLCIDNRFIFKSSTKDTLSYSWDFGDGNFSNFDNVEYHFKTPGDQTITLKSTSLFNNCQTSISKKVFVRSKPGTEFKVNAIEGCIPLRINFSTTTSDGKFYDWNFGDGNSSNQKNTEHIYTTSGIMKVQLISQNEFGCRDTLSKTINPYPVPNPSFSFENVNPCSKVAKINFKNTSTEAINYSWNFDNGLTSIDNQSSTFYTKAGTYNVELTAFNIYNCKKSVSQKIVIDPNIQADFQIDALNGCMPLTIDIKNTSKESQFYKWDFGDGNGSTQKNPKYIFTTSGFRNIQLIVENSKGCKDTLSKIIQVYPIPTIDFSYTTSDTCLSPLTAYFKNLSTGATEYAWNFGNGKSSVLTDPSSSYAQGGKYSITLVGKNSYNCSISKTKELEVAPELVADFEMDTSSGCLPLAVTFKNISKGGVFYNWDLGEGNVSTQKAFRHIFTKSGFISVQLIAENIRGCKDTVTKIVRPFPVPKTTFDYLIQDSCASPLNITLVNSSIGVTDNQWDFGNNTSSILTDPLARFDQHGTYMIQLVGSNSYNCKSVATKEIVVHQRPKSKFELSKLAGCMPFTLEITNNSEYSKYYNWSLGDGSTSVTLNPKHTYEKEGKFEIKLLSTDQQGCKDSISKSILVYPTPVAKFTTVATDPCYYPMYVETNNQTFGATKYAWEFSNGILTSFTHPTAVFYKDGVHRLTLVASNDFGCKSTAVKEIESYKTPLLTSTPYLTSICENNSFSYSVQSENTKKVTWYMGNGDELEGNSIKYAYAKEGSYSATVIGEGEGGCRDTLKLDKKIWVATSPRSNFETSQILNNGMFNGGINFINNSQASEKYKWVFGDGNTSDLFSPTNKYMNYGTFDVSLISFHQNGCTDTLTRKIEVDFYKGLFIPNAMYLGHQDYEVSHFVPKGVGLATYEISIYDDWGNLIWRSNAIDEAGRPTEAWDGTYKDQYVQQDSYVWKVDATFKDSSVWEGKEYEPSIYKRSGTVTVIK